MMVLIAREDYVKREGVRNEELEKSGIPFPELLSV